jgi:hypothetical protein
MKYKSLVVLLFFSQLLLAQNKAAGVKLISATVQDWMTGAAPGRAGTTYTIKMQLLAAKGVVFKNLWIGNVHSDFEVQSFFTDPNKKPAKGDSVLLVHTKTSKPVSEVKENIPAPMEYKGEALLEYYVGGRPRYLVIKKFEKKKTIKGI